jgi:tetratricopeptide (TPR) repeat protein
VPAAAVEAADLAAPVAREPSGGVVPVTKLGLAWYEDAPEAAFAAARAAGKRVVIDLWAPWCHTCLSMQNFVLTAENLPTAADRFVWLAVDTERAENSSFLERLPVSVWPTFYVVDLDERDASHVEIRGRWLGAASPAQFNRFLAESDRSAALARAAAPEDPLRSLATGDELAARGRHAEAARAYAEALKQAPADWARRPETWVAEMTALRKAKDYPACLEAASSGLNETGQSASAVDFAYHALACAEQQQTGGAEVAALRGAVAGRLGPLCARGSAELSPDDQADACDKLAAAWTALGKADEARRATLTRLGLLERASAGKPADVALTYDWARTDALLQLGRAEEALAVATERERQLPDNYNPPHYRAKSLAALGRWQEGLTAIQRALSLAYGPRKIGLMTLQVDLLLGAGQRAEAVRTLNEQLALYRALPAGQRQPAAEARVEQRLSETSVATPEATGR